MTTEILKQIRATRDQAKATAIARAACSSWMNGDEVIANSADNGWSTTALYEMPDGGKLRCDGRGWSAILPDGKELIR